MPRQEYRMTTPYGELRFVPTERDHVYVEITGLILFGVEYKGSVHVYRWRDGQFHIGEESKKPYEQTMSLYLTRVDDFLKHPSDAAIRKAKTVLMGPIMQWATDNGDKIDDAHREHLTKQLAKIDENVCEHFKAIEYLENDARKLRAELETA